MLSIDGDGSLESVSLTFQARPRTQQLCNSAAQRRGKAVEDLKDAIYDGATASATVGTASGSLLNPRLRKV